MKKQTISFTALPNGVAPNGKLRLSVFVSPRLWTDAGSTASVDLSEFPDWVDWPSTPLSFSVAFGGGSAVAATRVGDEPSSVLWKQLFTSSATLRPREFDGAVTDAFITSYSVQKVHQKLKDVYTYFAKNNPEEYPTLAELMASASPFKELTTPFVPIPPGPPVIKSVMPTTSAGYDTLHAVETFHKPFTSTQLPIATPDIEFHQMLSALGRYPVLMRMLGLVHDLEVDHPGSLGATTVRPVVSWPGAPALPRLFTRCFISGTAFYATPRASGPELSGDGLGMLKLNDTSSYEVVQVNHDGAAIKQLRLAEQVVRATFTPTDTTNYPSSSGSTAKVYKTADTPASFSLPSMSSYGIAVARVDRATALKAHLATSKTKNATIESLGDTYLDAEDVTRGYAIDVHDGNAWRSLNERVGTYRFTDTTLSGIEDEGWISAGMTSIADGSSNDSKLPETMFSWRGWSLSAPRPGKVMDANGAPVSMTNTPTSQFDLAVDFAALSGSLPKLRYGATYRVRARAVDLAGNRTPREAVSGFDNATAAITYGRFDPVPSPEIVNDKPMQPGDALGRIVIRSNYDTKIERAEIRHIAPPKTAEPMAEMTGGFDLANGGLDPQAYDRVLRKKDGGSWADVGKTDPNNAGVYYVEEANQLPYMPDLLSRGTVWRGLPNSTGPVSVGFYVDNKPWPDAKPFDLVLKEGSAAPSFEKGPRNLNVQLGKGDTATVRLSSHVDPAQGDIDRMGLLRWLEEHDPSSVDAFRQKVADAVHWMVTPYKSITLVHAVRQPLIRPKFVSLAATKAALGDTFATLHDPSMQVSRKSTVRLDILATWTEMIDSLANPGPVQTQASARPFQFALDRAAPIGYENIADVSGKHEFHDTKHRNIHYEADATSRFAEYFADRKDGVKAQAGHAIELHPPVTDDGINWGGVVPGSETVTASDGTTRYTKDVDYTIDYASGRLTPNASLGGRTVDIEFIAPPIVRRTAAPVDMNILSSARPEAPKVLYLVPTFGWSQTQTETVAFTSTRKGGGLRAYMERPWFSSGDGELLGVVIWSGATPPSDDVKPYVSDWGMDPVYKSGPTTAAPSVGAFTLATNSKTSGLSLQELPGVNTLHVAGHPVGYDSERKLWYCDLEIDAGQSYFPFVRLALARYQPDSMTDAHLSRVVLADFVQLTANRTASLTRPKKESDTFSIAVSGQSYSMLNSVAGTSTVEVSIERRRADTEPDKQGELAWEMVPASSKALSASSGPAGTTMWTGAITLPPKPHGDRFRIVIQEFETFGAGSRRLVYADAIEVSR